MLLRMKNFINQALAFFDIQIVRKTTYVKLVSDSDRFRVYELASYIDEDCVPQYLNAYKNSKSQLLQDLWVLSELKFKCDGYFVEFGATDGVSLSNTYLLESQFGWIGILAEPARLWHAKLEKNRNAAIEHRCVWHTSDEQLLFNEVQDDSHQGELSTIDSFSASDSHSQARKQGIKYQVDTISLEDMLKSHNAPMTIDYLSIDTEGSEYDILKAFDFTKYQIKVITCEHNHTSARQKIFELLSAEGYERKFAEFSKCDDWYVLKCDNSELM